MTDDLTPRLMRLAACGSQDPAQSAVVQQSLVYFLGRG